MYQVTLIHLSPDARTADVTFEVEPSRARSVEEITALLEAFRGIDPLQNADADPEIILQHRGARYVVRTSQGRLLFSDSRDITLPTLTLSPAEILAELDGSAAAARTRSPFSMAKLPESDDGSAAEITKTATAFPVKRRIRLAALSTVVALLLGGIAALVFLRGAEPKSDLAPIPATERTATARLVEGVYVTGGVAGDRGIVVGADGAIRIFELNTGSAPNFVHGTWQAGRINGALSLLVPELRTVVTIVDRETVVYCGERYRRAAAL